MLLLLLFLEIVDKLRYFEGRWLNNLLYTTHFISFHSPHHLKHNAYETSLQKNEEKGTQ
jgi:hypothetical protein